MIVLRPEEPKDHAAVHRLNLAAFENGPEAALVDSLRAGCTDYLAFVAVEQDAIVGHIVFTPVGIEGSTLTGMGLGPMAVMPARQRQGIGARLVRHGLHCLRDAGCPFVVVVGHPAYYPRFGFERASGCNLRSQWDGIPDEAFLVNVLQPAVLPQRGGVARYRPEFNDTA